jgi:hypothetical protein
MFRQLFNQIVEPIDEDDVLIPEDLTEIPLDDYEVHDEGDQEHQVQLDREIDEVVAKRNQEDGS